MCFLFILNVLLLKALEDFPCCVTDQSRPEALGHREGKHQVHHGHEVNVPVPVHQVEAVRRPVAAVALVGGGGVGELVGDLAELRAHLGPVRLPEVLLRVHDRLLGLGQDLELELQLGVGDDAVILGVGAVVGG